MTAVKTDQSFYLFVNDALSLALKKSHRYYYQVQYQLALCGRQYCDFVVWTTQGISRSSIFRDDDFLERRKSKLKSFYVCHILRELFTKKLSIGSNGSREE